MTSDTGTAVKPSAVQLPFKPESQATAAMSVTLHTNFGDLKIEVFCDLTPKTAKVSFRLFEVYLVITNSLLK